MDVGLKDFAILSDGKTYKNSKFFRSLEEQLAKGFIRWIKQRVMAARIYEYMAMLENIIWTKAPLKSSKTTMLSV